MAVSEIQLWTNPSKLKLVFESTEENVMVDASKSGTKVKRDKESRVTNVGGVEDTIKSDREVSFDGVTRPVSGFKIG